MKKSTQIRLLALLVALLLIVGAPIFWPAGIIHQMYFRDATFKRAVKVLAATYLDAYRDLRVEIQFGVKADGDI